MPVDSSTRETLAVVRRIEAAALRAVERLGDRSQHVASWFTRANPSSGDVNVYLVPDAQRPFTQEAFTRVWRDEIGDLPLEAGEEVTATLRFHAPEEGTFEVTLEEAVWTQRSTETDEEGEIEVWAPIGPVEDLPSTASITG